MKGPKKIRRGNQPIPGLVAWYVNRPKALGIFGEARDFPITTKELATLKRRQLGLFDNEYPHVWFMRKTLPDRKGQPCRVAARGRGPGPRNILVEFADGYRVVTHRHAVRRAK